MRPAVEIVALLKSHGLVARYSLLDGVIKLLANGKMQTDRLEPQRYRTHWYDTQMSLMNLGKCGGTWLRHMIRIGRFWKKYVEAKAHVAVYEAEEALSIGADELNHAQSELTEGEQILAYYQRMKPAFAAKEPDVFVPIIKEAHGLDARFIFDQASRLHPTCFVLAIDGGRPSFRFSAAEVSEAYTVMIVERWWSMLPLIKRLIEVCGEQRVEVIINLNDEGVSEGVAFCDNRPGYSLIPDAVYIGMKGYAHARDQFALQQISWADKADVVFWRGTSTGRPFGEKNELPRVSLCRLCQSDTSGIFDVGLTGLVDHHGGEAAESKLQSLIVPHVQWHEFDRYKYHIDIDGHTNSWPGLMFKLHSGGLVFKIDSPDNYRQWYYERLRPWENYVPVKADLSDLFDLVAYFRRNDSLARMIAEEGRRLALGMDFATEMDVGVRTILGRSMRDAYLMK